MRPGDFLLSTAAALSVAVLLVNDHVLKAWLGNTLTGKLSDVAGVFLLPLLTVAVAEGVRAGCRRPWRTDRAEITAHVLVVGLGFAAVKTVPVVGDTYEVAVGVLRKLAAFSTEPAVPIIVYRDATDLLVLPVLVGSYLFLRRRRPPSQVQNVDGPVPSGQSTSPSIVRNHRPDNSLFDVFIHFCKVGSRSGLSI